MRLLNIAVMVAGVGAGLTAAAETPSWYVITGLGHGQKFGMDQVGSNRDTICYPTDGCFLETPVPSVPGYRWRYAIDLDPGSGFELGIGRELDNWRFELTASGSGHDMTQKFTSIEYLDGSPRLPGDGTVVADVEASIDSVRTAIIAFSVLRKASFGRMNAYFGAGVGRAVVVVRDVRFRADYRSDSPAQFDPPLSFYNSRQDENLADRTGAVLLHVGADYPLTERISLGARLTYSHIGDIADRGFYIRHPMEEQVSTSCPHFVFVPPCFTNENTFDAANGWQLSATVRYGFRRR